MWNIDTLDAIWIGAETVATLELSEKIIDDAIGLSRIWDDEIFDESESLIFESGLGGIVIVEGW